MNICHTDFMKRLKININIVTHQEILNSLSCLLTFGQKEVLYFFFFRRTCGICSLTSKFLYMNVISCWNIEMLPSSETQDFKSLIFSCTGKDK